MANKEIDYLNLYSKDSIVADGNIIVPSHLKLGGLVRMNIQSEGKVVITQTGVVEGDIRAKEVQIHGSVTGKIRSPGVVIHKNSKVNGDVITMKLTVEEGAICNFGIAVGHDAFAANESKSYDPVSASTNYNSVQKNNTGLRNLQEKNSAGSGQDKNTQYAIYGIESNINVGEAAGTKDPNADDSVNNYQERLNPSEKIEESRDVKKSDVNTMNIPGKTTKENNNSSDEKDVIERFW